MGKKTSSPEQEKTTSTTPETSKKAVDINNDTSKKLAEATHDISKNKEKNNWKVGFGTTEANHPDGTMDVSSTGIKFKHTKKDLAFTIGATSISERPIPGEISENDIQPGISLNYKF